MTWVPLHLQGNLQGNLLVQGSSDDGRRPPAVQGRSASRSHISNSSRKILGVFKIPGIVGIPRVQGFTLYGVGFWGLMLDWL